MEEWSVLKKLKRAVNNARTIRLTPFEQLLLDDVMRERVEVDVKEYRGKRRVFLKRQDGSCKVCNVGWLASELSKNCEGEVTMLQRITTNGVTGVTLSTLPDVPLTGFTTGLDVFIRKLPQTVFSPKRQYVLCSTDGWWDGWSIEVITQLSTSHFTFRLGTGTAWVVVESTTPATSHRWTALHATVSRDRVCLYVNSVLEASCSLPCGYQPSFAPIKVSEGPFGLGTGLPMTVRGVRVINNVAAPPVTKRMFRKGRALRIVPPPLSLPPGTSLPVSDGDLSLLDVEDEAAAPQEYGHASKHEFEAMKEKIHNLEMTIETLKKQPATPVVTVVPADRVPSESSLPATPRAPVSPQVMLVASERRLSTLQAFKPKPLSPTQLTLAYASPSPSVSHSEAPQTEPSEATGVTPQGSGSVGSGTTLLSKWRNLMQEQENTPSVKAAMVPVPHVVIPETESIPDAMPGNTPKSATLSSTGFRGSFHQSPTPTPRSTGAVSIQEEADNSLSSEEVQRWVDHIKLTTAPNYGAKGLSKPAEIRPGLFLGDSKVAKRVGDLTSRGIKKVVNLAPAQSRTSRDTYFGSGIEYLEIAAEDDPSYPILRDLPAVVSFIDDTPCLVHCFQGVNRSAVLVAAYIMCIHRVGLLTAIKEVYEARPVVFVGNDGFLTSLVKHAHKIGLLKEGDAEDWVEEEEEKVEEEIVDEVQEEVGHSPRHGRRRLSLEAEEMSLSSSVPLHGRRRSMPFFDTGSKDYSNSNSNSNDNSPTAVSYATGMDMESVPTPHSESVYAYTPRSSLQGILNSKEAVDAFDDIPILPLSTTSFSKPSEFPSRSTTPPPEDDSNHDTDTDELFLTMKKNTVLPTQLSSPQDNTEGDEPDNTTSSATWEAGGWALKETDPLCTEASIKSGSDTWDTVDRHDDKQGKWDDWD
eukprot:TRINITY_DN24584_c0_g1_i1.p1 TRINITY_DN24584_c0_g1~~TRINITY_DN24584_c0_g1_i1.p1  ORF type:complete len:919 (+),score=222.26 TRINITY_DN24584_c0_g1_i1:52-2808(+)